MLLDTCALLAYALRQPMRADAIESVARAQAADELLVSSISALEIAQKVATGKLRLMGDDPAGWFDLAVRRLGVRLLPLGAVAAFAAYRLPEPFHKDPAVRVIVATARLLGVPVITVDGRILAYGRLGHVDTLAY